jgi:hypothetical protein
MKGVLADWVSVHPGLGHKHGDVYEVTSLGGFVGE